MASFNIHLAVAKLYAERGFIKDLRTFYKGTIDPDLTDEKDTTHYGFTPDIKTERDTWRRVVRKVDLKKYLESHNLDNDYNRGCFLHLVVDYKFFHEFFGKNLLSGIDTDIFSANLYHTYGLLNPYLVKRYNLDEICIDKIADFSFMNKKVQQAHDIIASTKHDSKHSPESVFDIAGIDAFIREAANVDLESIARHARISSV